MPSSPISARRVQHHQLHQQQDSKIIEILQPTAPFRSIDMFMSIVGPREAEHALLLGHMYSTEEAHRVGLIDKISDDVVAEASKEMDKWLKIQALLLGHMYSTEEAHRVGLIDKISDDVVAEASKEMDKWLKIQATARKRTKDYVRQKIRERFIAEREQDKERFLGIVTSDATQETIGAYLANLSKKQSR